MLSFIFIEQYVAYHERDNRAKQDNVHHGQAHLRIEKIDMAIDAVFQPFYYVRRNALRLHLRERSAQRMITHERSAVRAGQKRNHFLQATAKGRNGHIRPANETVARAYDRADRRNLSLRR